MIRKFCDQCGKEITETDVVKNRITMERNKLKVEIIVAVNNVWNGGDACRACVIDVINSGVDVEE